MESAVHTHVADPLPVVHEALDTSPPSVSGHEIPESTHNGEICVNMVQMLHFM